MAKKKTTEELEMQIKKLQAEKRKIERAEKKRVEEEKKQFLAQIGEAFVSTFEFKNLEEAKLLINFMGKHITEDMIRDALKSK